MLLIRERNRAARAHRDGLLTALLTVRIPRSHDGHGLKRNGENASDKAS